MTFSGDFNPVLVKKKVQSFLMRLGFHLNPEKLCMLTKNRQEVTGLVVNQNLQTSKEYRRPYPTRMLLHQKIRSKRPSCTTSESQKRRKPTICKVINSKINYILYVNPSDSEFLLFKERTFLFFSSLIPNEVVALNMQFGIFIHFSNMHLMQQPHIIFQITFWRFLLLPLQPY